MQWEATRLNSGPYVISYCHETRRWDLSTTGPYDKVKFLAGKFSSADEARNYVEEALADGSQNRR